MNIKGQILQVEQISSNALLTEVEKLLEKKLTAIITTSGTNDTDAFLTRQEVAELFKVSLPTVHAWMNAGILKYYKIANKTRFLRSEVLAAATGIKQKGGSHE